MTDRLLTTTPGWVLLTPWWIPGPRVFPFWKFRFRPERISEWGSAVWHLDARRFP